MKHLQRLGKALMQAVAVLPVAALLLGIGYAIDPTGWGANNVLAAILIQAGDAVLSNLGIIFAIAVAYGLSRDKDGAAALSGFVGFMVVTTLLKVSTVAQLRGVPGDAADVMTHIGKIEGFAQMKGNNVFVGILVGIMAAWVYNRFHNTKLPDFLAFFSGRRLVPIVTSVLAIVLSGVLYFIWPVLYSALVGLGKGIIAMGPLGAGIYAFFNRLLIPTGLHHALNAVFWFDIANINDIPLFLGGAKSIAEGTGIVGVTGRYQAGFFPIMMFGLPGAALAMYHTAKSSKKKMAYSLLLAGALTSFVTGVTEPLEFAFMFLAPVLYLIHAVLTGISVFIAASFQWIAGFGFSAGLIDMVLSTFNPLAKSWYMLLVQGVVFFLIYYFIFRFFITRFDLKTPGREDDVDENEGEVLTSSTDFTAIAAQVLKGLGGAENIDTLDYCATRLRVSVNDHLPVKEAEIKKARISGVIRPGQKEVQVIIGPQVQFVYDEMKKMIK